jgi:hypothetical protein
MERKAQQWRGYWATWCNAEPRGSHNGWCCGRLSAHDGNHDDLHGMTWSEDTPTGLVCADCGLPYQDFPLDTTIPDEQWHAIFGGPGGVLCASCIVKRAAKLPGAVAVRARIEFAHEGTGR